MDWQSVRSMKDLKKYQREWHELTNEQKKVVFDQCQLFLEGLAPLRELMPRQVEKAPTRRRRRVSRV